MEEREGRRVRWKGKWEEKEKERNIEDLKEQRKVTDKGGGKRELGEVRRERRDGRRGKGGRRERNMRKKGKRNWGVGGVRREKRRRNERRNGERREEECGACDLASL